MHFASPISWWLAIVVAAAIGGVAFAAYRRPLAPLTPLQRSVLVGLRVLTLVALALFLFRPVVLRPPAGSRSTIVPVLVDVSRSMRLADTDGQTRIARAVSLLTTQLLPALSGQFAVAVYAVGDGVAPAAPERLHADARRSDLSAALDVIRDRYRGQRVSAIVLFSDGGDTGQTVNAAAAGNGPPVFAVGIGAAEGLQDREVLGVTTGDPKLDQASVDLRVSSISHGFGRAPFQLRVLANGRVVETRRIVPPADGSPIDEVFTVSPDPLNPTVFTADIPTDAEAVVENNARSVLVSPAGRKRRLLMIEGAPGFEHTFVKRALTLDPGIEVDAVTRKGKNADGENTFFVQAGAGRGAALTSGFPSRREDLYAYDGIIIANVEGDFFTRAQLAMTADFVAERGGGLLVLGGRSFAQRGLIGTPLEVALPVELNDRRGVVRTTFAGTATTHNKLVVTPEGENHPIMRIGGSRDETRRLWAAVPPLAASAPLGGPRPGATVLAVAAASGGGIFPVVAVQRYGQGRSMIFAGEASWRWKMMLSSTDRSHEFFWRQAARWLAGPAPDPVTIAVSDSPEPGDAIGIDIDARDATFAPVTDATVDATLTSPGGQPQTLKLRHADSASGRFSAPFRPDQPGLYRVHADARRGTATLGGADKWVYVGGGDREFADPRLNEGFLRRVARASGGRYVRAADTMRVVSWLQSGGPHDAAPERRDVWHSPWTFALVVALLGAEWVLRRRWGLR